MNMVVYGSGAGSAGREMAWGAGVGGKTLHVVFAEEEAALGRAAHGAEDGKLVFSAREIASAHKRRRRARESEDDIVIGCGALLEACLGRVEEADAAIERELVLVSGGLLRVRATCPEQEVELETRGPSRAGELDDVALEVPWRAGVGVARVLNAAAIEEHVGRGHGYHGVGGEQKVLVGARISRPDTADVAREQR